MMPGVMHSVKILENEKVTSEFKQSTMQRIKERAGNLAPDDLEDEAKYAEFHSIVIPKYEEITKAFDVQGAFAIGPPIMDPFAIVGSINPSALPDFNFNISKLPAFNPLDLAPVLEIPAPNILVELGKLVKPGIPPLPPLPSIPDFSKYADFNLSPLEFNDRFLFESWPKIFIEKVFIEICTKFLEPPNILGLVQPTINVDFAIKLILDAQLFGPTQPEEILKAVVIKDLAEYTAHCTIIATTASIIGDGGPSGVVGKLTYDDFEIIKAPPERKAPPEEETTGPIKKTSSKGKDLIKRMEGGFQAYAYPDAGGHSIGFGHFIQRSESGTKYKLGVPITREQADQQFDTDISVIEKAINENIHPPVPLTQQQYDALASFLYNSGPGKVMGSAYLKGVLNQGNYRLYKIFVNGSVKDIQGKFLQALVQRRKWEAAVWDSGDYSGASHIQL